MKKAVELLEHVVGVKAKFLGDDYPSRLVSQAALAVLYVELMVNAEDSL